METNTIRTASDKLATSAELTFEPGDEAIVGPVTAFSDRVFEALSAYPGQFSIRQATGRITIEGIDGQRITPFLPLIGSLRETVGAGVAVTMYRTEQSDGEALFATRKAVD